MVRFHLLYPVYETDYHAVYVKNGQDVASFRKLLKKQNFTRCQCINCIWYFFLIICVNFFFFSILNIV